MRTIQLVGAFRNSRPASVAYRCQWCRRFKSIADMTAAYNGALVRGRICKSCAAKLESEPRHYPQGDVA